MDAKSLATLLQGAEFWSALVGAVVGSIMSGLIAWLLAALASTERRKGDREADLRRRRAVAMTCTLKLKLLVDDAFTVYLQLRRQLGDDWGRIEGQVLASRLLPVLGPKQGEVSFAIDELAFLLEAGQEELMNDLIVFSQRQGMHVVAMAAYGEKREQLSDHTVGVANRQMGIVPQPEHIGRFQVLLTEVADLADVLTTQAEAQYEMGVAITNRFGAAMKAYFKDRHFPAGYIEPGAFEAALAEPLKTRTGQPQAAAATSVP